MRWPIPSSSRTGSDQPWARGTDGSGRGVDNSPVDATPYVARGHGREVTFQHNVSDWDELEKEVRRLAERVTEDIRSENRSAIRVGIKVRYAPFITTSRSLTLEAATEDPAAIADAAADLLGRLDRGRAVRLVGVRAEMGPPND